MFELRITPSCISTTVSVLETRGGRRDEFVTCEMRVALKVQCIRTHRAHRARAHTPVTALSA